MPASILAISEGGPEGASSFRLAARVARELESTVDAVYFSSSGPDDINIGAQAMPYLKDLDRRRLEQREKDTERAHAEFTSGISGATFGKVNKLARLIEMGQCADLVVISRPASTPENLDPLSPGTLLEECPRPVMIAPPDVKAGGFSSIVLAWNGSRQAARSTGYALPFLKRADKVIVLIVDSTPEAVNAGPLARNLARHGVAVSLDVITPNALSGRARGRALLGDARDRKADLLVMGAFGGGQLKTYLGLGSATGKVVSSCPIPLLLAQ